MIKIRKAEFVVIGLVVCSFLIAFHFYAQAPEMVASHWNSKGEVNGYLPRFWGAFLVPFALLGLVLLFLIIPKIDPLRGNIERFRAYYDGFVIIFCLFMLSIQVHGVLWNQGVKVSPNIVLPIGLGLLFYYLGVLMGHAKRNWFIGVRTPWTLSSDRVWDRTHRIAGVLFKIAGVLTLFGVFFQQYIVLFIALPVLFAVLYTSVYSYMEYRRERAERNFSG